MYLSVATTHSPATDLGFLLHKHPERLHEVELTFGKGWLFYPEASEVRCEATLLLDVDPVALVRGKGRGDGLLDQYVNDRPYAVSSFLSVAMNRSLRTAMAGTCAARPELAEAAIPLEAVVTPLPARGGEAVVRSLFEPLGWTVSVEALEGAYVTLRLAGTARLSALLTHLYVLIPVLDDGKHYWVGEDEVEKLLRRGEGWLDTHPARELIARRYLGNRRPLTKLALARLSPDEGAQTGDAAAEPTVEPAPATVRLNDQRMDAVAEALRAAGARVIADLGCGEGKLLYRLVRERWVEGLIGLDPSSRALEIASKRLKLDGHGGAATGRVTLLHGSVTYRDDRWAQADAAALVEVIEHLDEDRLPALERVVFGEAKPSAVVVTTPNAEYNALYPSLDEHAHRHDDHRFEWTRAHFRDWAARVEAAYGYRATFGDVGPVDPALGSPTQMAVFAR